MKKHRILISVFILLAITYVVFTLVIPPEAATLTRYQLNPAEARLLSLTVILPLIAIWFTALFGYIKIKDYSTVINNTTDGRSFAMVAHGLKLLALSLPVSAILAVSSNLILQKYPGLLPFNSIIINYINLAILVFSFYALEKGSGELAVSVKKKDDSTRHVLMLASFIIFGALFVVLTLKNPAKQFPIASSSGRAAYYLPDVLLIITIIIPYLYVWYKGLKSTENIMIYRKYVHGKVYRYALSYIAGGVLSVAISFMLIRYLNSLTTLFNSLTLKYILIILYLLLLFIAIGYVLIAVGAKKLKKIEEV